MSDGHDIDGSLKLFSSDRILQVCHFLLLVRYVPNIAKRSIWDQCKKKYILRTDRPTDRPTDDRTTAHSGKFQMTISPQGLVWSTSCLVLRWGFWGCRIEWRYFRFRQIQDWKIQMAISPRRIIRFTPCLVLGWGFRGRRIEWRYFRLRQIKDGGSAGSSDLLHVWF